MKSTLQRTLATLALGIALATAPDATAQKLTKTPAPAPGTTAEAPAPIISSDRVDRLASDIKYLSSDELEGRRTGTRGNLLAAGYLAGEMASIGLQPVDGSYLHDFSFLDDVIVENASALRMASPARTIELSLGVDFNPLGFSSDGHVGPGSGTDIGADDLVFVGYGISAPDNSFDEYAGLDIENKIVVMLRYSPDGNDFHGQLYQHSSFAKKVVAARSRGAAGIIMVDVHQDEDGPIPVALTRGFHDVGLPVVSVRPGALDDFTDPSGRTLSEIRTLIDSTRMPHSFVADGWTATMNVDVTYVRDSSPNVLGLLSGNDPTSADELIVIGAHFDHLGHGGDGSLYAGDDPAIHNGADDNASGTAAVLELARHFVGTKSNQRSILFVAFNGEEEGLLGSSALVDSFPFPTENVVAMINMDMIGRLSGNEFVVQGTGTASEWDDILATANNDRFSIKTVKDGYGPSDHTHFYANDIPVLFFFTGLHDDYHRPSDDFDLVNVEGVAQILGVVESVTEQIDKLDGRLTLQEVERTEQRNVPRLRVVLGIMPDYGFDGKGLRLTDVSSGGPADKGGMRGGDVIVEIGSKAVGNIEEYMIALGAVDPGEDVEVVFERDGEERSVTITPSSR